MGIGGTISNVLDRGAAWTTAHPAATGAVAGTPGGYTPVGARPPANLAGLTGKTATPATAWTAGQYVALRDGTRAYWNGTAWVAGVAPGPAPTVTGLSPASVSLKAMPPIITITGTNFLPGLQVLVDGVAYPTGQYVNATTATFVPSASAVGTQQISVRIGGQTSATTPLTVGP